MREIAIAGIGMHRFGRWGDKTDLELGLDASKKALKDAGMKWRDIQAMACGKVTAGMSEGNDIWALGGATGIPIVNLENACATAGSALRLACQWVAGGFYDICLAVGIDKMPRHFITVQSPSEDDDYWRWRLAGISNPSYWAMDCNRYIHKHGMTVEKMTDVLVKIAVKNKKHGAMNPNAWYQKEVTPEEVLKSPMVAYPIRQYMICTPDEGGAAAVVTTKEIAKKYANGRPIITVAAYQLGSKVYGAPSAEVIDLSFNPIGDAPSVTTHTAKRAFEQAGIGPEDIDLVELQDTCAWNEVEYFEDMGFCKPGEGPSLIVKGETSLGGTLPVNLDGGLISKGEPPGASQLAQVHEIVLQLRGTAGPRQVEGAKVGLCHVYGGHGNASVVILKK